jgi:hypothetical protein
MRWSSALGGMGLPALDAVKAPFVFFLFYFRSDQRHAGLKHISIYIVKIDTLARISD